MDLKGTIVDTNVKIYPSEKLLAFLSTLPTKGVPPKILEILDKKTDENYEDDSKSTRVQLTDDEIDIINKISSVIENDVDKDIDDQTDVNEDDLKKESNELDKNKAKTEDSTAKSGPHLSTKEIEWLYSYLQKKRKTEKEVPYLHVLLEGSDIVMPENRLIKRNPVLEERCVKLRAQQEAREYRKMTKTVDNVRMNFPEDSISYQLRQVNRQLIAVGQFVISIFAGFLFGFKGIEWMIGSLDFGFRLLLGVMCALIIALAEIYFLAKKLNEELNVPETTQLGGPPQFTKPVETYGRGLKQQIDKEHVD